VAKLVYSAIASLDLYVYDEDGGFGWARPDAEVHAFVNDLERPIGTYLYGRRMYETMEYWQTHEGAGETGPFADAAADYASIWQAADKVVYSRTLAEPSTPRTRIERDFDADAVRALKAGAERDLSIGGAELAGQALSLGLVDECHLFLAPVIVGGGMRALPAGVRAQLELVGERRFASGFVHLHYRLPGRRGAR
jgi:dihydrofolate reductase